MKVEIPADLAHLADDEYLISQMSDAELEAERKRVEEFLRRAKKLRKELLNLLLKSRR